MSVHEIFEKIQSVIAKELVHEEQKVTQNAHFTFDLGADYLDLIAMYMALEDTFKTKIPYEDVKQLTTVKQVVNYINQKVIA